MKSKDQSQFRRINGVQVAILIIVGMFAVIYVCIAIATKFAISTFITPKFEELRAQVTSNQAKVLADLKLLDQNPIFTNSPRTKDAQAFISRYVGWETDNSSPTDDVENKDIHALQSEYPSYSNIETLRLLAADPRIAKVDVSWIDQIESYDYWNLASSTDFRSKLDQTKELNGFDRVMVVSTLPLPGYDYFRFAALIRFLQLQKQGDALKGLRLIRQVSHLSHTTYTLVGGAIAVAGLSSEHRIVEAFGVKNWKLIERERISAYKRVSYAWGALSQLASWDRLPDVFDSFLKPSNGVCATASERVLSLGIREFLEPTVFLEPDYSIQLKQNENWSRKLFDLCSMPEYLVLLEPTPEGADTVTLAPAKDQEASNAQNNILFLRLPFVRRGAGLVFLTIAAPNHFKHYDDSAVASSAQ